MKGTKIYTPSEYLKLVTGQEHTLTIGEEEPDYMRAIAAVLEENGLDHWDYPIEEIDHIHELGLQVVLVDCSNKSKCYRWYENE